MLAKRWSSSITRMTLDLSVELVAVVMDRDGADRAAGFSRVAGVGGAGLACTRCTGGGAGTRSHLGASPFGAA